MDRNSMPQGFSIEQLKAFAASPAGQQLMKMMQSTNPQAMQNAAIHASRGDTEGAKAALSSLLSDPAVREMISKIGGNHGGL